MPTFTFQCGICGAEVTALCAWRGQLLRPIDGSSLTCCEREMRRLMSAPAIHYKGSGFYSTDYNKSLSDAKKGDGDAPDVADKE